MTSTYQSPGIARAAGDKTDSGKAQTSDQTKDQVANNQIADPSKLRADSQPAPSSTAAPKVEDNPVLSDGSLVVSGVDSLYASPTSSLTIKSVESSLPDMSSIYQAVTNNSTVGSLARGFSSIVDPFDFLTTSGQNAFDDSKYVSNDQLTRDFQQTNQNLKVQFIQSKMTPEMITKMRAGIDQAFQASYGTAAADANGTAVADASVTLSPEAQALEAKREDAAKKHKPGDKWYVDNKLYQLDAKGDLLIYTDDHHMQWIGSDGSQYERNDGVQIWRKGGREIKAEKDGQTERYTYRAADGSYQVIDGKARTLVEKLGEFQSTFIAAPEMTMETERALVMTRKDGLIAHGDAVGLLKTDAQGNRILLDSKYGVYIYGKDGKNYHIDKDGHLMLIDSNGVSHEIKELSGILTRNADGTFQFGTIKIEQNGSFVDSERDIHMAANQITYKVGGHSYRQLLQNGHWLKYKDGVLAADSETATGKIKLLEDGKPVLNYDFNQHEMKAIGITFGPTGTKIDRADFTIENSGAVKFDDGSVWSGTAASAAGADSVQREAAISASGAVSDFLAQATTVSGKAASQITEADVGVLLNLYMQLGALGAALPDSGATSVIIGAGMQSLGSKMESMSARAQVNENMRARGLAVV